MIAKYIHFYQHKNTDKSTVNINFEYLFSNS